MIIKWLDDAKYDLQALYRYITQENPAAANRVANRILDAVNLLLEQPEIGRQGRVSHTRELIVSGTPYLIPYRVKNNVIEILRVFHGAMQWPKEFSVKQKKNRHEERLRVAKGLWKDRNNLPDFSELREEWNER